MGGAGPANKIAFNPPNNKVWLHVERFRRSPIYFYL